MTLIYILIGIITVFILLYLYSQNKISKLRKMGLYPEKEKWTIDDVRKLINAGYKIEAIKLYRKINNIGLKEAKEAVEKIILTR